MTDEQCERVVAAVEAYVKRQDGSKPLPKPSQLIWFWVAVLIPALAIGVFCLEPEGIPLRARLSGALLVLSLFWLPAFVSIP
jgi:hypothetical protein